MLKIILLAIQLNFSLGFMFNVANRNIIHLPVPVKKINILNSIDYDPSQIINKLARSAGELDKYNLNHFK